MKADAAADTAETPARRPGVGLRRIGYGILVVIHLALLAAIHVWPGWQAVPFLTAETTEVLGLVSAALIVGAVANLLYIVSDATVPKAVGELVDMSVGLVALVGVWRVFPFEFEYAMFDWASLTARLVLVVSAVGLASGIVVRLTTLFRALAARAPSR